MSHIKISGTARTDLQRLYDFLAQFNVQIADNGIEAIFSSIDTIKSNLLIGSPLSDRPHVRKLVVSFGASGYLVFHKRYDDQDINLITRIIHQKEWYDTEVIGKAEEIDEENNH